MDMTRRPSRFLKRIARFAMANPITTTAVSALSAGYATVFLLHRFADAGSGGRGFPIPTLVRYFEWLRSHRYRLVGLRSLIEDLSAGRKLPARTVAFTVDDGYSDFYDLALPQFRRFEVPVSVFLVTDFLDRKRWLWWDQVEAAMLQHRQYPCTIVVEGEPLTIPAGSPDERNGVIEALVDRLKFMPQACRDAAIVEVCEGLEVELPALPPPEYSPMTWDQAREVNGDLITFGPHTLSHPILALETEAEVHRQVRDSWGRVQAELPAALPVFCYPNGDARSFGRRELDAVADAGLAASLSTLPRSVRAADLPDAEALRRTALPRYSLEEDAGRFVQLVSGTERIKSVLYGSCRR